MGRIVVVGAGICGVSAALWLQRAGREVILLDRLEPGEGASYGNAGVIAACSVMPVTSPGLLFKAPLLALDPEFPLFVIWRRLPAIAPWLARYLSHANDRDTRRISNGLAPIITDAVEQHRDLASGTGAEKWLRESNYYFAYESRDAFLKDRYRWMLKRKAGFVPEEIELQDGRVNAVATREDRIECSAAVLAAGVWSKGLTSKLGLKVPLETERGYHVLLRNPSIALDAPVMIASGKIVATPMAEGLRIAGILEFGSLSPPPSAAPLEFIMKKAKETFPGISWDESETWMGHRPAPSDSLPLIGEIRSSGVFAAFGHHHVGLTGGPKTGRIVANVICGRDPGLDISPYSPQRFVR